MNFIKKNYVVIIATILFLIPFFWLKNNQVNLGGDSSRLYFYDPYHFLVDYVLYGVNPWNLGGEMVAYFMIPFTIILQLFQYILKSPHNLINFFNALIFLISFLGTYGSIYTIIGDSFRGKQSKEIAKIAGITGGLFYIFAPTMTNWDRSLITFYQTFLDPAIFFLLYKYFQTKKFFYVAIVLLITFVFASNFSFIGAPTFFSFYPFVFIFFLIQSLFLKKEKISLKKNLLFLFLFIGIQAFHLIPQIYMILNPSTDAYKRVFVGQMFDYVNYFKQVAEGIKASSNLLGLPQYNLPYGITFFVFPLICIISLLQKIKTKEEKNMRILQLVLSLLFLLLLFFISGKITNVGFNFYANLFRIPGFGMFRNFDGQFVTSFFFFYALLIGVGFYSVLSNVVGKKKFFIILYVLIVLLVRGWPLLNGSMLYLPVLQATNNTSSPFTVPESLKQALSYISSLPEDSKILTLPLTDFGYQMIAGQSSGLYIGPSFIGPMTLKKDFTGYDAMDVFGETLLSSIKSHNFSVVKNILAILNIHSIFWERNSFVYGTNFPNFPYQTTSEYIPTTKEGYQNLINNLPIESTKKFGTNIEFLSLSSSAELPFIFPSTQVVYTNQAFNTPFLLDGRPLDTIILPEANYTNLVSPVAFEPNPFNPFAGLDDDMQFHEAVPQVSWKPGTLMYPIILWKENRSVSHAQGFIKFISAYLFLAKRIEELNKWKNSMQILHTNKILTEPRIWEISKWEKYGSWEMVLSHYYHQAQQVILSINKEPQQEIISDKIITSEQFKQHKYRLLSIIDISDFSSSDKRYLSSYINTIFDSLQSNLNIGLIDTSSKKYTIHLPAGIYKAHVSRTDYLSNISVDVLENANIMLPSQTANSLENDFTLTSDEDVTLTLHYTPQNLVSDSAWESSGRITSDGNEDTLELLNSQDNSDKGISRKIAPVPGINQYAVSFQYKTSGKKFIATLLDKRKNSQGLFDTNIYSSHVLESNDWELYQTILTIDPKTVAILLQIINKENQGSQSLLIKGLSIVPIVSPIVTVEKQQIAISSLPDITFQRINPTKYRVIVKNAQKPFVLTMLNKYSANWKIYGPYKIPSIQKTNLSYLNGTVNQGVSENIFADKDIIKTLFAKPIADERHFSGDGYANSWVITPSDVQNKQTYEVVIELQSQKLFYIGSIITLITFIIVVAIFFFSLTSSLKNSRLQRKH